MVLARLAKISRESKTARQVQGWLDRRRRRAEDREFTRKYKAFDPRGRARRDVFGSGTIDPARSFSAHERAGEVIYQSLLDDFKTTASHEIQALDLRMSRLGELPLLNEKEVLERAQSNAVAVVPLWKTALIEARLACIMSNLAQRMFKTTNGLIRQAVMLPPYIVPLGFLLIFLGEAGLNAWNLTVSGAANARQSVLLAAMAAGLNLALGYSGALGLRSLNHLPRSRRIAGWVTLAACAVACCALQMLVATYRFVLDGAQATLAARDVDYEKLAVQLNDAFLHLGQAVAAHPFAFFDDLYAIFSFFVGLVLCAAAAWFAYHYGEDKHPGYAETQIACDRANAKERQVEEAFRKEVFALVDHETRAINALVLRADQTTAEAKRIVDEAAIAATRFETRANRVDRSFQEAGEHLVDQTAIDSDSLPPEEYENGFAPLDRDLGLDLDGYCEIEEELRAKHAALRDDAERIKSALATLRITLDARVKEALTELRADAMSKARTEAALRDIAQGYLE